MKKRILMLGLGLSLPLRATENSIMSNGVGAKDTDSPTKDMSLISGMMADSGMMQDDNMGMMMPASTDSDGAEIGYMMPVMKADAADLDSMSPASMLGNVSMTPQSSSDMALASQIQQLISMMKGNLMKEAYHLRMKKELRESSEATTKAQQELITAQQKMLMQSNMILDKVARMGARWEALLARRERMTAKSEAMMSRREIMTNKREANHAKWEALRIRQEQTQAKIEQMLARLGR